MRYDEFFSTPFTKGIIRNKVQQLIGKAGFQHQDRDDLEQEMGCRLLQSFDGFDPNKGCINAYTAVVLDRVANMILRERLAKKRHGACRSLDSSQGGKKLDPVDEHRNPSEAFDVAEDVGGIIAELQEQLRILAEMLMNKSKAEVARDLKLPRTTLDRRVQQLRKHFENAGLKKYL